MQGDLNVAGEPVVTVDTEAHGVVVALTPSQAEAGQGTPARFVVRVTNTGSAEDTFSLSVDLPPGVTAAFGSTSVDVPPGASNFRDVALTLTPDPGTSAGDDCVPRDCRFVQPAFRLWLGRRLAGGPSCKASGYRSVPPLGLPAAHTR